VKAFLRSFVHAWRGLRTGARGRNFRVMLGLGAAAGLAGAAVGLGRGEWALLTLAAGLVLAVELVNSAGEALVDLLHPDHDPRAGRVKDLLAGASLAAALAAAIVGLLVFLPHLLP